VPHTHKSQGRRSSEAGSLKTVVATVLAKKRVHLQVMWEWVEVLKREWSGSIVLILRFALAARKEQSAITIGNKKCSCRER